MLTCPGFMGICILKVIINLVKVVEQQSLMLILNLDPGNLLKL